MCYLGFLLGGVVFTPPPSQIGLSGDIWFMNIVAAPNFLDTGINFKCENSFTPIIGESVLRTDDNFKDWWDNTFMSYIRKFGKSCGNEFIYLYYDLP